MRATTAITGALLGLGLVWSASPGWGQCPETQIGTNASVSGTIDTQDCLEDGYYFDEYYVVIDTAGTLTVVMTSPDLDAYLELTDSSLNLIAEDDDSAGGTIGDARISPHLDPGEYLIYPSTSDPGQTGSYTLTTTFEADDTGGGDTLDVSGTWTVTENVSGCGETYTDSFTMTVTQDGTDLTVVTGDGTFSGSITGNTITWTGSYPEEGGTTTITSLSVTLDASGEGGTGTVEWSWSDGTETCSGTTALTLAKGTTGGTGGTGDTSGGGGGGGGCFLQQLGWAR